MISGNMNLLIMNSIIIQCFIKCLMMNAKTSELEARVRGRATELE